jgi:hypothetical protein
VAALAAAAALTATLAVAGATWPSTWTGGGPTSETDGSEEVGAPRSDGGTDGGGSDADVALDPRFLFPSVPSTWHVSTVDGRSTLEDPTGDVSIAFQQAPIGQSLGEISEQALSTLTVEHGIITRVPSTLSFEGQRSLAIGAEAEDPTGSPIRFVIVAVTGPAGNAVITIRFGPDADASVVLPEVERILSSFRMEA